jgi:hypothetical protein
VGQPVNFMETLLRFLDDFESIEDFEGEKLKLF